MKAILRAVRAALFPCILALTFGALPAALLAGPYTPDTAYRWQGHPFVFVFTTDDGTKCNLGWAEVARAMDFRFTISVNKPQPYPTRLTAAEMHQLYEDGFEISSHTYSHGQAGVPLDCPIPPRGSLLAYDLCEGFAPGEAMTYFQAEIERDSIAAIADIPVTQVRTLTYPNHRYSHAVIDSLRDEGFLGARFGENSSYGIYSYYEFTAPARNSWDGGISLFRVPLTQYSAVFFGNHSADPPVHFTYPEFVAATQPYIDRAIVDGGMFVIYAHHYGDDDDSFGDINYGSGGLTAADLAWMVSLVRQNGGVVMTLAEAMAYYRMRSSMVILDGDYVWQPAVSGVDGPPPATTPGLTAAPNPFNASTRLDFTAPAAGPVTLDVCDLAGQHVRTLVQEYETAGPHSVVWDGRSDAGRNLSSGVYEAVVAAPHWRWRTRLTLLK